MLEPFISYSLSAVLACQHGGVNRMGHTTSVALYGCQVSTYGMTPRPQMTLWLSLCLVYSIDSPGSYSHMSLGFESVHVIAWRDCTCSHTVRVKYQKGTYSVTIVTSVPWDMEWVLHSWPCYELHSSVASFEEIWDASFEEILYSQTARPFWQAMAGCIAIGSHAAAEALVHFLVLHEPMDKFPLQEEKIVFLYKHLRCSTRSISQGTDVTNRVCFLCLV